GAGRQGSYASYWPRRMGQQHLGILYLCLVLRHSRPGCAISTFNIQNSKFKNFRYSSHAMKYCPNCGQPALDSHRFCMRCGADVSAAPVSQPQYYAPQASPTSNKAVIAIVVAVGAVVLIPVVLIIAAIAIPNLLRARIAANEASAV